MRVDLWATSSAPPTRRNTIFNALVKQWDGKKWHKKVYSSNYSIVIAWHLFWEYKKYMKKLLQSMQQNS